MGCLVYIFVCIFVTVRGLSDQRLCADPKCEEPISLGEVVVKSYVPNEAGRVRVQMGDIVTIYSKGAGSDNSLWGVEVRGNRGYIPKKMLQETKVFRKKLVHTVSTEEESPIEKLTVNNKEHEEHASSVPFISNSFSVVDGTTIYGNTTDDVLETQPIETIPINMPRSGDIQSSKTIDATSISKNKLDEPNSSIILPQPTTSSTPAYGASADEIFRETPTKVLIEDTEKSTVDSGESEINSGEHVDSGSTKSMNKDNENVENRGNGGKENIEGGKQNVQDSQDEEAEDENDDEEEEEEDDDEEEDEDGEVDRMDLETGENEDEDGGEDERIEQKNDKESNDAHEKSEDNLTESSENKLLQADVSEPEMIQNIGENVVSIDSGQKEVEIHSEPVNSGHQEERLGVEDTNGESPNGPNRLDNRDIPKINVDFHENNRNDYMNEADHLSKVSNVNSDEKKYNTLRTDTYASSFEISDDKDELFEINVNVTENSDINTKASDLSLEDSTGSNSLTSDGSNSADQENLQGEEQGKAIFNPFSVLGNVNKIKETQDVDSDKNENGDSEISSEKEELQNNPVLEENMMVEETSSDKEFQVNGDLFSSTTEESPYAVSEDDVLGQTENEESTSVDSDNEENNTPMQINTPETSREVQGTCAVDGIGCMPENEDKPKQLPHSEEAEHGWLTSLFESTNMIAGVLVPSTSREMNENNLDIFQSTQSFLIVTAITVLVFTLGYYYIEKQRRDHFLRCRINRLEEDLMIITHEKYTLKDELEAAKEKLPAFITSVDSGEISSILKDELEESQAARLELEEQVSALEKELEAATEAGLELNRMMSELLSAQHGSDTLMKSVEHLQKQLDSQQTTINTMTANLKAKNIENENLQSELKLASEHALSLEDQLAKVNEALTYLQKEKTEIEHDFQVKNQSIELQLVESLENKSADSQRLCRELDALQDVLDETRKTLAAREGEVSVLRECLNHVECVSNGESGISLEELLNVGHLRAMIDNTTKERDELLEKLQGEEDARKLLEDHMKIVSEEVSTLQKKYEEADRGKMEAQTRLEVLSNYFKEKETQLQKELGLQEAMYIQKEGDALSTIEQIKAFQEEIENYKAQNEILKKEILDQERSMKSQIAMLEKKVHENWVSARQAERRLEESKQEASQLRNRLTMSGRRLVGTIPGPDVGKPPERGTLELEHNGEISSSPAHMGETQEMPASPLHFGLPGSPPLLPPPGGQPLPPGPFPGLPLFLPPGTPGMPFSLPPPPGGLFPDDLRPPPLGRMSSPPPEPRGSFSPFEHSPPMSPPNRPYRSPPHYDDSPSRYRHQTPPSSSAPFSGPFSPGKWEERSDPPRSSFRPLHRDPPREPKGSTISSGHSSESLDKGSRHSRV